MATTSIWQISGQVTKVLKYITNPAKTWNENYDEAAKYHQIENVLQYTANEMKTEKQFYVTGINCSNDPAEAAQQFMMTKKVRQKTGGVVCFHGYQSFARGEVTPEQAHEIGLQLAREVWGDRFEVLVATHINTMTVHNHFVINSVSFRDGMKYDNSHADYRHVREVSDRICREHGLSVIPEPEHGFSEKGLKRELDGKVTQRVLIRRDIDKAIDGSRNFRDFSWRLQNMGYVLEYRGSFLRVRPDEGKKFYRLDRLGEGYTEEDIRERIKQGYCIPKREQSWFPYQKRDKRKGLYALYLYYLYLLGAFPKSRTDDKEAYAQLRKDSAKMQKYSDEAKLLAENKITNADDLKLFTEQLSQQFKEKAMQRAKLRNKLRHMYDSERMRPIKDDIAVLTEQMAKLRMQMKLCVDIADRSSVIESVVNTIDMEHENKESKKEKEKEAR